MEQTMNSTKRRRLLVVDDATQLLFSLRRLLADMSDEWELVFMDDPVAALAAACAEPFDVVVSDFQMPVMDGAVLVQKIKAVTPEAVCLIMTGSETDADMLRAMDEVSAVIQKPFETAVLRQAINIAVAGGA
jgi:DNA-binding NarL/FixJ family response regulator